MKRAILIASVLYAASLLAAPGVQAQVRHSDDDCALVWSQLLAEQVLQDAVLPSLQCQNLAGVIQLIFSEGRFLGALRGKQATDLFDARDLQSRQTQGAGGAGALSQGEAVPSAEPFALAGGSFAAIGSDAGSDAITALTINPSIFFINADDSRATAQWGRFTDLTFLFPVNDADRNGDKKIDYFGARGRINITGLKRGSDLFDNVVKAYDTVLRQDAVEAQRVVEILQTAPDLKACAAALVAVARGQNADTETPCGTGSNVFTLDDRYTALTEALDAARQQADARYFGLDLRTDFGDPTLGAVDSTRGTYLFGGFSWGQRFDGTGVTSSGIRARLGVQFIDLSDFEDTFFALDGAVGFEMTRPFAFQQLRFAAGADFRFGGSEFLKDFVQTDYLNLRGSLNVPITNTYNISLSVGLPVVGETIGPVLSINANWNLLWPDKLSLPQ